MKDAISSGMIFLESSPQLLKLVEISKRKFKEQTINRFDKTFAYPAASTQLAQQMYCEHPDAFLTKILLSRSIPSFGANPRTRFRLHIYGADNTTGGPKTSLHDGDIIVENNSDKYIVIDLSKKYIRIPGNKFFVAIEWLAIPFNETPFIITAQ